MQIAVQLHTPLSSTVLERVSEVVIILGLKMLFDTAENMAQVLA